MEDRDIPIETYQEYLLDIMKHEDFERGMVRKFQNIKYSTKKVEDADMSIVNFILFIFYTTDKVAILLATKGYAPGDNEYYHKLLLIEDYLCDCMVLLGREDLFNKAVETYASYTANA